MREIRTSGLMSGGLETRSREPNCRHGAKATERPPDPKAGAPAPDSTVRRGKARFPGGMRSPPNNCRFACKQPGRDMEGATWTEALR